jgi:hypothetical protein
VLGAVALAMSGCASDATKTTPSVAVVSSSVPAVSEVVAVSEVSEVSEVGTVSVGAAVSVLTCGDVFANTDVGPVSGITYVSCATSPPGAQLRSVTATYRVTGDPKAVEAELADRFGMTPLVFRCCGWEPANTTAAQYTTDDGYIVMVSMASGETVERDWSKVAFTVDAQLYLESP